MATKTPEALGAHCLKKSVETMTLLDLIERVPPSMMQLLVALAPTIHFVHRVLVLATWRGGYRTHIQSWLLLLGYILTCLYGYEVLRYAPQIVPLAFIAYASLRASFARVSGHAQHTAEGATTQTIKRAIAQLCDISDFVSALCETLIYPLSHFLHAQAQQPGINPLIVFLVASWPLWLMMMLPPSMWITPYYFLRTTVGHVLETPAVQAARAHVVEHTLPAIAQGLAAHAPKLYETSVHVVGHLREYVFPLVCSMVHLLDVRHWPLALQVIPPFPIAALSVRYVLLIVGCIALTWCSPWATLIRVALWRSALVRHTIFGLVRVLSGSENLCGAWRSVKPRRLHGSTSALVKNDRQAASHETVFQFEIFENQRWWIGLDWTAALLPNERPSWSDSENNAVAPPPSFTLPSAARTRLPSSVRPGREDVRVAEWHWVDLEWRVAGAQSITSTVYTPASAISASEAQRLSHRFATERSVDDTGRVLDAADRLHDATDASARSGTTLQEASHAAASSMPASPETADSAVPEELSSIARPAALASTATDVDPEGWQYGDNAWDKLTRINGIGKYTRRRCWVRRAVLVITVEHGAVRAPQE